MKPDAAERIGKVMEVLLAVDMTEDAVPDAVLLHEGEDVHGASPVVIGRIVKHAEDAPGAGLFRQLDAAEEPALFPAEDHGVGVREFLRGLRDPAPRAGKGDIAHADDVVVEEFKRAAGGAGHLADGIPPVVVVPADDDFPAGKGGDPEKVGKRFGKILSPREVSCKNDGVFFGDGLHP